MTVDTHPSSAAILLGLRSASQPQVASHDSAEGEGVSPPNRGGRRISSVRLFIPLTPILACPLVTPLVVLFSNLDRLEPQAGRAGLNINGLTTNSSVIYTNQGKILDAITDTSLSRSAVPPILFYTPPTPPRSVIPQRSSTIGGVSHSRTISQPSAPCLMHIPSPKSSLERSKSVSHFPKHPLCLSAPLPRPSEVPYPSDQDRRTTKHSVVDFPAYDNPKSLSPPAIDTLRQRKLFHLEPDNEDTKITQAHLNTNLRSKKIESEIESDGVRRYHALMELLRTEAKYLLDLRTLVTIYLQQLPMVTTRLRTPSASYFGSSSASNVITRALPPSATSTFGMLSLPVIIPPTPGPAQRPTPTVVVRRRSRSVTNGDEMDKGSLSQRQLFSEEDLALISRNAKDLLDFHDRFVEELKEAVAPFGPLFSFSSAEQDDYPYIPTEASLNQVIRIIVSRFFEQATSFSIYRSFCSTHTEACELIQKTKKQHPVECAIWEKRCHDLVENLYRAESIDSEPIVPPPPGSSGRGSGHSSDMEAEQRSPRRPRSVPSFASYTPSKPTKAPVASYPLSSSQTQSSRLMLMDYLIKPVQRICKYHLLLDQLKVKKSSSSSEGCGDVVEEQDFPFSISAAGMPRGTQTDALVTQASNAMHAIVDSVNDDRRRHEYHFKSLLIASRMVPSSSLSPEFLRSLGACLLAGALDVVYHRPSNSNSAKAKYLGTFLYVGGYLVLTKVAKGKIYDPVHWFPLAGFEVVNAEEDDPCFPYSFHLNRKGHHFHFAAACQKEKEAWMEGLRESICSTPGWTTEPISSLRDENREEMIAPIVAASPMTFENPSALPTIESLSELEGNFEQGPSRTQSSTRPKTPTRTGSEIRVANLLTKLDMASKQDSGSSLSRSSSRRSSTASVKAIFSPFLFDSGTRITRSSSLQRQNVEQGLADVFSDLCRDARSRAELHSVELFQIPRKSCPALPRSTSSMAIPGLRHKRENKLISRRSYAGTDSATAGDRVPRKQKTLSDISYRRVWPAGAAVDSDMSLWNDGPTLPSPETLPDYSVCSSGDTSGGGSSLSTPIEMPFSLPSSSMPTEDVLTSAANPLSAAQWEFHPKRSQSMVENVRSFFTPHTPSRGSRAIPTTINLTPDWTRGAPDDNTLRLRASVRKRTQSTPTAASEHFISSGQVVNESIGPEKSMSITGTAMLDDLQLEVRCPDESKTLNRKLSSFLHPYARRELVRKSASDPTGPTRRRSLKDILHHFRSNSFTPIST